jgi:predicted ATPase
MPDLPTGTVTLLFTDIAGSTKLLHELGPDAYGAELADHRRLLRAAFAAHGGVEIDTQGDAFFIAFAEARGAIAAARDVQVALEGRPVSVRMGLHTGSPKVGAEGYVGADVHLAARIASAGHGGQILLSQAARGLVDGTLTDLGEHRLKDFAETVRIFQVGTERFPPLRTISNTNLPRPASTFVGREREIAEVTSLLRDGARLVTLTGPGGTGKTRLSIEVASELVPDFKGGVFWVPVAVLRDPALVIPAIAQAVGAKDELAEFIADREMLLVTDNLEQVVESAPDLASLVEACQNLRLMTTSRELLRVRGEVEYPVPPLADREAVELFANRSGLAPNPVIEELCQRLENLPLAVELAAARARVLSPAQILERLAGRLDLLKGGRDADPRQQTLRAAIEWSHDLLTSEEKRLFASLAVFRGGSALDAAERIAGADIDALQALVEKSLLRHSHDRFWMLETIREFAAERLAESGAGEDTRQRHADYFLALAEDEERHLRGPQPEDAVRRLGRENDNIRSALAHFQAQADADRALRLAGALDEFWCDRAEEAEGLRHLENALGLSRDATAQHLKALLGAAHLARDVADPERGTRYAQEAMALAQDLGDKPGAADALTWLAACAADQHDFERARMLLEDAANRQTELGDHEAALLANRLLAWTYYELGDRKRARAMHEANLERARELGAHDLEASVLGALAEYAVDDGRVADAMELAAAGIGVLRDSGDRQGMAIHLVKVAYVLVAADEPDLAVKTLASSSAWYAEVGSKPLPFLAELADRVRSQTGEQLGAVAFEELWREGGRLDVESAAATALAALGARAN